MSTINAASSTNRVVRMIMSKSRALLRYSSHNTSGVFVGPAQFVSRLSVSEFRETGPFTLT